ncbi:MAG: DMT family transporter [Actinomycetota bacterium]|nr:DMT family transporter [Actinomycetota bacterium]
MGTAAPLESASAERRTALLLLVAMAVCWGGTWPTGKLAVEEVPPAVVATLRFALSTAMLWLWTRALAAPLVRPTRADLPLVLLLGLTAVAGYNLLFLYGLSHAPASDGAIIVPGLAPLMTALLAASLLGERLGSRAALGLVTGIVGLVLVVDPGGGLDSERLFGDLLFLAGAFVWGVFSVLGRRATSRFGTVGATLYATAVGTGMLAPLSFLGGGWGELAEAHADAWISIAYLAVFGTVVGFVLFYEGVRRIGPSSATSFTLLVPVFGVLSSVLLLDEQLGVSTVLGGIVVISGLWLVQSRRT